MAGQTMTFESGFQTRFQEQRKEHHLLLAGRYACMREYWLRAATTERDADLKKLKLSFAEAAEQAHLQALSEARNAFSTTTRSLKLREVVGRP